MHPLASRLSPLASRLSPLASRLSPRHVQHSTSLGCLPQDREQQRQRRQA